MRDKVYSLFPSFYFLVSGLLVLLRFAGNLQISETEIFGIVFLVTSPVYLYFSFGRKLKGGLISATFLFLLGVVFLVVKQWEILNLLQVVLPSVFFIPGGIFLILFIDNTKKKNFLFGAVVLFVLSALAIVAADIELVKVFNRLAFEVLNYWEALLVFVGLGMLVG